MRHAIAPSSRIEIRITAMPPAAEDRSSLTPRTIVHTHISNANAKITKIPYRICRANSLPFTWELCPTVLACKTHVRGVARVSNRRLISRRQDGVSVRPLRRSVMPLFSDDATARLCDLVRHVIRAGRASPAGGDRRAWATDNTTFVDRHCVNH